MNKVPRKVWKKEVILSWKSLENCSQISVPTLEICN